MRVLALILSIVLSLGSLEGFLHLVTMLERSREVANVQTMPWSELPKPNQDGWWMGKRFHTNSVGLRSPEIPKESIRRRVVVIGDSITAGCGTEDEEAYPRVAERLVQRHDPDVDIINAGLAGLNTQGAVDRLAAAEPWHPRIIVYGFTLNDIEDTGYISRPRELADPHFWWANRFNGSRFLTLKIGWPRLQSALDGLFVRPGSYEWELVANWQENQLALKSFSEAVVHLEAAARGRCVIVLLHTYLAHLHPWHPFLPIYAKVSEAARTRGFLVEDPFRHFEWRNGSSYWIRPDDPHPNAAAHEIFAAALADAVRRLPSSCWSPPGA